MAKGFKHGAGGSNLLNFKVVGNPQPDDPKENTIWVNTDVEITGFCFSGTEPENGMDGSIWFITGISSAAKFNAVKKNGIILCPLMAKQYVDGAPAYREAALYKNGEWVYWWDGWLFNAAGNQYEDITGGWVSTKSGSSSSTYATIGTDSITVSVYGRNPGQSASLTTANLINLSQFNTLNVNVTAWSSGDNSPNRCQIRVIDANNNNLAVVNVSSKKLYTIDVSSLEAGHIQLLAYSSEDYIHKMTVNKIWLE